MKRDQLIFLGVLGVAAVIAVIVVLVTGGDDSSSASRSIRTRSPSRRSRCPDGPPPKTLQTNDIIVGDGAGGEGRRHADDAVRRRQLRRRQAVRRLVGQRPAVHLPARRGPGDPGLGPGHRRDEGRRPARADRPARPRLRRPGPAARRSSRTRRWSSSSTCSTCSPPPPPAAEHRPAAIGGRVAGAAGSGRHDGAARPRVVTPRPGRRAPGPAAARREPGPASNRS